MKIRLIDFDGRKQGFKGGVKMECPYYEPSEYGDICHSGREIECPNPYECTAIHDEYGNSLQNEINGSDDETYGFY